MAWRRWLLVLLVLVCCAATAMAEDADAPTALSLCTNEAQVLDWLNMPIEDEGVIYPAEVQEGYIRYIAQNENKDPFYCRDYWCSVEEGDNLDLNAKVSAKGNTFKDYAGTMCTRAVYAMAISYLGYGTTPGDMSALLQERNIPDPYDDVTDHLEGLERITYKSHTFEKMLENYETDPSYSPVYLYMRKPNGVYHAVLIVGRADRENYYLVVDPATHFKDDEVVRVYRIRFDVHFRKIINSTYRNEHRNGQVVSFCQWHKTDGE